ncbi:MAG: SpoIIE family protein phosphatase [Bacteroidota bacterium]
MKSVSPNSSPAKARSRQQQGSSVADASYESHFDNQAVFEFSTVINSSLDQDFIHSHILRTLMGKLMSARGMVLQADPESNKSYVIEKVKGFEAGIQGTRIVIPRMPRVLAMLGHSSASRQPWMAELANLGVRILLPLMIVDKPIGALAFGERFSDRPLLAREKTYLRSLANISATAIEKARTIDALQLVNRKLDRKIQELNTLFDLGKEFGSLLDREKLVRLLVFSLLGQVGVSRYLIALRDGPDMNVVAAKTDGTAPQGELLSKVANVKAATLVENLVVRQATDPRPILNDLGLKIIVPMQLQGETRGVLLLGEKLNKEGYAAPDIEFLASLANLAIISIENARLFNEALEKQKMENELMIAREIQKGLLPSVLPTIDRLDIAATNISSKQVGGDYYDIVPTTDGRHIIAIGDVSGKGTPAALLMANLQATIRALVPLNLTLSEQTGRVNDLLCQNTGGNKFVTFFWGYISSDQNTLTYVNAGHNYPYLFHTDGSVDRLDKGGMILGIMPAIRPYEEAAIPLSPGDILVLFTDGVSEAMNRVSEEFGEDRLEAAVRAQWDSTASEIIEAVHRQIQEFTVGAPQSDDITMMVVKVAIASPSQSS